MRNTFFSISLSALALVTFTLTDCKNRQVDASTSDMIERPNIVLFFVDDLGWSDLGFRNSTFETPISTGLQTRVSCLQMLL